MRNVSAPGSLRHVRYAFALALAACAPHDEPVPTSQQKSLVQLELTYSRDVSSAAVLLDAEAHFVRYRTVEVGFDQRAVATLLGLQRDDELAVGACRSVEADEVGAAGASALQVALLDAGPLTVRNGGVVETVLEPHHYPELLPFVSGVVYGQEGPAAREPSPSARIEIEAEGGEDVGPFVAAAIVPRAFPSLLVIHAGRDVELSWTPLPGSTGSVLVDLRWASFASVRCRAADDGLFSLGRLDATLATKLDDALAQGAQLQASVSRGDRVTLDAPGAGPGRLLVTLRDTAQLSSP